MKATAIALAAAFILGTHPLRADEKKAELDQKIELLRGMESEYASAKVTIPRTKKQLDFDSSGAWDKQQWDKSGKEMGPAAKVGDQVQVTGIKFEKTAVILEINHGNAKGTKWYNRVEVGVGGSTRPVNAGGNPDAKGTIIAVHFKGGLGDLDSAELKKLVAPILDFDKRSATEQYFETLAPEVKQAIKDKKPIEGMDRDQVLLALGRPLRKTRETKDGIDLEDWIFGEPPGRVMFVTFEGAKVVKVKETYAGLGGSIAETPKPPI